MTLHPHLESHHQNVCGAAFTALEELVQQGSAGNISVTGHPNNVPDGLSVRNLDTLVRLVLPEALERSTDANERLRESAERVFLSVAGAVLEDAAEIPRVRENDTPIGGLEKLLRDVGLVSRSHRVRERTVHYIVELRSRWTRLSVKPLLPALVDCLMDADPGVRSAARHALETLFVSAPSGAKTDLKRELEAKHVKSSIADGILQQVLGGSEDAAASSLSSSQGQPGIPPALAAVPDEEIRPEYVTSRQDLERTFASFQPAFQGKETELNWQPREKALVRIRGMLKARVPAEYPDVFPACVRNMQEGILKALGSLRTTLAMHAIYLIRQLALDLGHELESSMEAFLTALIRMAGITKKMVASGSQVAVSTILACVPFRTVNLTMLQAALQDKNAATRVHTCRHLGVVLTVHGQRRHAIEAHGGLDILVGMFTKALGDPNPEVRGAARDAFCTFYGVWQAQGDAILNTLPLATKKQVLASVERRAAGAGPTPPPPRPGSAAGRRTGASSAVLAAKRAASRQAQRRDPSDAPGEEAAARPEEATAEAQPGLAAPEAQPSEAEPAESAPAESTPALEPATELEEPPREAAEDKAAGADSPPSPSKDLDALGNGIESLAMEPPPTEIEQAAMADPEPSRPERRESTASNPDDTMGLNGVSDASMDLLRTDDPWAARRDESKEASAPERETALSEAPKGEAALSEAPEEVQNVAQSAEQLSRLVQTTPTPGATPEAPAEAAEPARGPTPARAPAAGPQADGMSAAEHWFLARHASVEGEADAAALGDVVQRTASGQASEADLTALARLCAASSEAWNVEAVCQLVPVLHRYTVQKVRWMAPWAGADGQDDATYAAALAAAYWLAEREYALIVDARQVLEWLALALSVLRDAPPERRTLALGATEAMLHAWSRQADPVLASSTLMTALEVVTAKTAHAGEDAQASLLSATMHTLGRLFLRLPPAVLEDQLVQVRDTVKKVRLRGRRPRSPTGARGPEHGGAPGKHRGTRLCARAAAGPG